MRRTRTFLAVELSSPVVKQARKLVQRMAGIDSGVRWVVDDNMHMTLQFLGDIDELEVAEVCSRTIDVVRTIPAFAIQVQGIGGFPNLSRPRTIWGGVTEGLDDLRQLQQAIEAELHNMRFPREKRQFQPHLTLGRVRSQRNLDEVCEVLRSLADYSFGPSSIDEVIVFSSELTSAGPLYTRMGTAELS